MVREAAAHHVSTGVLQGTLKGDELYTATFVERHRARVRGAFAAVTEPTTVRKMVQQYGFLDSLAYAEVRDLAAAGLLAGTLHGSEERSSFHPALHAQNQEGSVRAFFDQNGFLPYSSLKQLEISAKS